MSLGSDLAEVLTVEVHARAARVVNLAGHIAEGEGVELNELQTIAVTQALLACFDGIEADFASHLDVEAGIRTARWLIGPST